MVVKRSPRLHGNLLMMTLLGHIEAIDLGSTSLKFMATLFVGTMRKN